MSNDLVAFDVGAGQSAAFQAQGQIESLSDGIGQSYGTIHYKGKVWSVKYKGETKYLVRLDDGTPAASIDLIFLRSSSVKSKSFYPQYVEGQSEGSRPICSSMDGIRPDPDVQIQQAEACAACPRNVFKQRIDTQTNQVRKFRECSDFKRIAVLLHPEISMRLFGQQVLEPMFLRVPAGSLEALSLFDGHMTGLGFAMNSYVTRITFDPKMATPKYMFKAVSRLTDQEAPVILQLREDSQSKRIIGLGVVNPHRPMLALPQQTAPVQPTHPAYTDPQFTQAPVAPNFGQQFPQQSKVIELEAHRPQQQATLLPELRPGPVTVDMPAGFQQIVVQQQMPGGMFTGATVIPPVAPTPAPVVTAPVTTMFQQQPAQGQVPQQFIGQTVEDTGVEASDPAMDTMLANLLQTTNTK